MRERLDDGVVRIRRYHAEDAPRLYEAAAGSVSEVSPWLPWLTPDYTLEDSEQWIARVVEGWETGETRAFWIEDLQDGRFLGGVGLNQITTLHRRANLGYWTRSGEWGRGIAGRGAALLAQLGLEDLDLPRIEIVVALDNHASVRVAEKIGARREGVLINRLDLHGELHDALMFSITPGWRAPR